MKQMISGRLTGKAALKALFLGVAVVAPMAFADDSSVGTAVTALQTATISNIGLVVTAAFAVLVAALVPDIGLGLAKKWIKKGAS